MQGVQDIAALEDTFVPETRRNDVRLRTAGRSVPHHRERIFVGLGFKVVRCPVVICD